MENTKKIVILVLSHYDEIYQMLEKGIKETWAKYTHPNVKIFFYHGGGEDSIKGDKILTKYPEGYNNIGYKTIKAFELLLQNYEFDYIFRTNSSSYVNINKLVSYLEDKPTTNFYNGIIGEYINGIKYGSGCGYSLSKDVVEKIVENKNEWPHNFIDDVALGELLSKMNIFPTLAPRLDINSLPLPNKDIINQYFHFRCKTEVNRNDDVNIMRELDNFFKI